MPPCATKFSFNALFLAFCGPAGLIPVVVKHSSAVNRKLFVKTDTKTDVALRAAFGPDGFGHRLEAGSIPRIILHLSYNMHVMEPRSFSIICKFIRGMEQSGCSLLAGYSGAEVIPGTEPVAGPIKSRAAID
jgi:hypothetical protein